MATKVLVPAFATKPDGRSRESRVSRRGKRVGEPLTWDDYLEQLAQAQVTPTPVPVTSWEWNERFQRGVPVPPVTPPPPLPSPPGWAERLGALARRIPGVPTLEQFALGVEAAAPPQLGFRPEEARARGRGPAFTAGQVGAGLVGFFPPRTPEELAREPGWQQALMAIPPAAWIKPALVGLPSLAEAGLAAQAARRTAGLAAGQVSPRAGLKILGVPEVVGGMVPKARAAAVRKDILTEAGTILRKDTPLEARIAELKELRGQLETQINAKTELQKGLTMSARRKKALRAQTGVGLTGPELNVQWKNLDDLIAEVEAMTPEQMAALGPKAPPPQVGAIQAGMGIGERPAQGEIFAEFGGAGTAGAKPPLIEAGPLQAAAERRAALARGQLEMGAARPVAAAPEAAAPTGEDILRGLFRNLTLRRKNLAEAQRFLSEAIRPVIRARFGDSPVMGIKLSGVAGDKEWLLGTSTAGWDARMKEMGFEWVEDSGFSRWYRLPPAPETALVKPAAVPPARAAEPLTPPAAARAAAPPPVEAPVLPSKAAAPPPVEPPVVPPTTGGGPPGGAEPAFAANIRLSKYPDDIRDAIKTWADANPQAVQEARRGIRTDAQVLDEAKKLVEDMGGDFAKFQGKWKPGEAWNAEEVTAIRGVLRNKTEQVVEAARVARADNSAANHAKLLLSLQEQARIQSVVHGVSAEAGRALRSFRQEAFNAIQSNDVQKLEELLRRVGDRAKLDDIAAAIARLDINNPVAVNNFLRQVSRPGLWDYVMELFINSILSGPKTHIINALSNTLNTLVSPLERITAVGVERVLAPLQRRPAERFLQEILADALGAIEGLGEGVRAALSTLRNGINPAQASKWEFRRAAFRGTLGKVIRAPGTALEAADSLNFAINYRAALNASIVRQAKVEGLRGVSLMVRVAELKASPTETLIKRATEMAEYRLFRKDPGQFTARLMALRDAFPPLRFVIPFLRTPVNLVKFGLERSPVGALNPSLWRNIAAKNPVASDQIARVFLGSTLAAAVAWQFAKGRITGMAPRSAAARDRFYREGKLPFAIRIGDTWVQYQRLEPFNQPLAQIAAAIEAIQAKDKDVPGKVEQAISTMGQNLVSQTYLSGIADLLNMLEQPERYTRSYLSRIASGMIPGSSLLRTIAQMTDPVFRRPGTFVEQLKGGIPGLSRQVPPVITAFGEEAPRESPAFFPIQVTRAQQSVIDAELERLGIDVGFVGKSIGGVELTPELQREYQVEAGQAVAERLLQLIQSGSYKRSEDTYKERVIRRVVDAAREAVRAKLVAKYRLQSGAISPLAPGRPRPQAGEAVPIPSRRMPAGVRP